MGEIYVVVTENNKPYYDDEGPMVFEQYVRNADLERAKKFAKKMEPDYGKCRVARLVFVD